MKARHLIGITVLLFAFGLRTHLFTDLGTQADEGAIVTAAWRILEGDLLYRDLFWNHTPGLPLLLALTFRITGPQILTGRLIAIGAALITVSGLILAGRWLNDGLGDDLRKENPPFWSGYVAALLFAVAPLPIFWSRFAMMENLMTAFAVLSIALAIRAVQTMAPRSWFLAGLMAGLALLFKVAALVLIGSIALFLLIWWLMDPKASKIRAGLMFVGGIAVAVTPVAMLMLIQGNGQDFIHLLSGAERLSPLAAWQEKTTTFLQWVIRRPFAPLAFLGFLLAARLRKQALWLITLWATFEMLFLFLAPKLDIGWGGFSHYVLPAVAALCLLAGAGVDFSVQQLNKKRVWIAAVAGAILLIALATIPGLARDLNYVTRNTTYPSPGFEQEEAVGRALALAAQDKDSILVLGNGVLYLQAQRAPANRFYHYPQYLPDSRLAAESDEALTAALQSPDTGAVLLTRAKQGILSEAIKRELTGSWMPVATLPYDYQGGATLFMPTQEYTDLASEVARFDADNGTIILHNLASQPLSPTTFLIELAWSTTAPLNDDYTVFVHILGPDGMLVAQHDSMPVLQEKPTTSWKPAVIVNDRHWLTLPPNSPSGDYQISVGMYQLSTGNRLQLSGGKDTAVSFPLQVSARQ